ncbi:Zinc metalloproteinase nas-7 [Nymphon striatum]|nr:Zinc metalloproteinase nas-7 [Nymphon striatum]
MAVFFFGGGEYFFSDLWEDDIYTDTDRFPNRNAIKNKKMRWPDDTVYYYISEDEYSNEEKNLIRTSLETFTKHTCKSEVGFLRRRYKGQRMSLGDGCLNARTVRHEFVHALGFYHEQQRPDRNKYVEVFYNNIQADCKNSYKILDLDTLEEPYDYHSITQYTRYECAIDPTSPTMMPKRIGVTELGGDDLILESIADPKTGIDPLNPEKQTKRKQSSNIQNCIEEIRIIQQKENKFGWEITANDSEAEKDLIRNSLKTYANHTCIKMIEISNVASAPYSVFIRKASGCYSEVGCLRRKRGQRMSLGSGCLDAENVRHEFMHVLGFYHEQNRPDRNKYVEVFYNNIQPRYNRSYQIMDLDTLGEPYDYHSITHYKKYQCAINPKHPTMWPKERRIKDFGGVDLSPIDIDKVNKLYECSHLSEL